MPNPDRFFRLPLLPLLLLLVGCCLSTALRADDKNVTFSKVYRGDTIYLTVHLNQSTEVSVTFTATLVNMVSSVPLPRTVELTGPNTDAVVAVFRPIRADAPSHCTGSYEWEYGRRFIGTPRLYSYLLPYRTGPFEVIQGAHGAFSHNVGSPDAEAIDWAMPIGTPVYPARPGVVIGIRTDCSVGGPDIRLKLDCNYIIIKHDDGTMAEYLHLQQNGALVRLGARVTQETPIALSGNTGYTTVPHLHFSVFTLGDGSLSSSVPVVFRLRNGGTYVPEAGWFY
jgi:murein DD-endopeptidase MepM/ murein hydrolase activator NlpD